MRLPTGSSGRLLALALLLLPLALAYRLVALPLWQAYQEQSTQLTLAQDNLERFQRLAARLAALREQAAQLRDESVLAPFLLDADNDALAAAQVQQRLKDLAQANGGRILSTRVLSGEASGPFKEVTINARLQIPLEGLQVMMHALETTRPFLFFEEISIMNRPRRRGRQIVDDPNLETRLTLFGLRRVTAAGTQRG
jgi:general secretion pathway protein M